VICSSADDHDKISSIYMVGVRYIGEKKYLIMSKQKTAVRSRNGEKGCETTSR
jgi:hypothetical protein